MQIKSVLYANIDQKRLLSLTNTDFVKIYQILPKGEENNQMAVF